MKALVTLASLVSLTAIASADNTDRGERPSSAQGDTYIALDGSLGSARAHIATVGVSVGHRLSDTPLFVRGAVFYGISGDDGRMQQVRAGLEARRCDARGWACAFAGLDVGYQHDHAIDYDYSFDHTEKMETNAHDILAMPRAGVELGRTVKLRLALEAPLSLRVDDPDTAVGLAVTAGVAAAF